MEIKQCQQCDSRIPKRAQFCSVCGYEIGSSKEIKTGMSHLIISGILVVFLLGFGGYYWMQPEPAEAGHTHTQQVVPTMSGSNLAQYASELPEDYQSLLTMGNSLMDQQNYAMAAECYSKANKLSPGNPDLLVDLGTCQHSIGNHQAALTNFNAALLAQPDHQVAKFNMGIVYYSMQDTTNAIGWWQKLLDEKPGEDVEKRIAQMMQMARQ